MRSLQIIVTFALLSAALAGCAETPGADASSLAEAEAAAAALNVQATATTGVIRGVIVDQALRPLAGALVMLQNTGKNATSTDAGAFAFDGLEAGTYFLTASLTDYTTVQQSADVVAGVSDPAAIKILLTAVPRGIPSIESFTAVIFVSGSGWVTSAGGVTVGGAGVLSDGNWNFRVEIAPNGTVAQTELVWDMTTPLGVQGRASGGTYGGDDGVDTKTVTGPSPLVMQANATEKGKTSDSVYYSFYAWPDGAVPAGLHINQKVDAYVHVFHNFLPNEGWQFGRDGDHPLP